MLNKKELEQSRNEIYSDLTEKLEGVLGTSITRKQMKKFYADVFKLTFIKAAETGYLRLPSGMGLIRVTERKKLRVNTPTCGVIEVPNRLKIKFESGTFQKKMDTALSLGISLSTLNLVEEEETDSEE